MHSAGHLQDFVCAKVRLRQHVAAMLDHVGESCVIDDHRIESLHVERALPGSGHSEHVRLRRAIVEEGADHTNGLPAVVERRVNPWEAFADNGGSALDAGASRKKNADTSSL